MSPLPHGIANGRGTSRDLLFMFLMLTLGYKASAEQFGPRELLDFAILAEELGFDSVVVSDHFHPWRDTGGHAPFSFAWLGAVAARTKRIRIGTSVVTPSFRYHPAIVAQAMATVALLAPGRVFLGVGSGESMNETPLTVSEWPEPGERLRRLREAVRLIKRMWSEDYVTFEGKYFQTREAKLFDKPAQPIPILIAAGGPQAAADRAHTRFIVSTDAAEHLEKIAPYLEWGFTHLVFHFPGRDQARAMRLYAKEVLPRLRSRA